MTSAEVTPETVARAFKRAEGVLKRYERLSQTAFTPAINQLRYAGSHLSMALAAGDDECRAELLVKAYRHCERATFDTLEVTISEILSAFGRLQRGAYTAARLEAAWPEYRSVKPVLLEGQRILAETSAIRDLGEDGIAALQVTLDGLLAVYRRLLEALDSIDGSLAEEDARRETERIERQEAESAMRARKEDRRYWIGIGLSAFGVALTLAQMVTAFVSFLISSR